MMKRHGILLAAVLTLESVRFVSASEPPNSVATGTLPDPPTLVALASDDRLVSVSYDLSRTFGGFLVWLKNQQLEQQRRRVEPRADVTETRPSDKVARIDEAQAPLGEIIPSSVDREIVLSFGPAYETGGLTNEFFVGSYFGLAFSASSRPVGQNAYASTKTVGAFQLPDGTKFTGEMDGGLANGWGVLTQPSGTRLSGEWRDGMPYRLSGIVVVYDGTVENGTWDYVRGTGSGTITWRSGLVYEGSWKNVPEFSELPEGTGTMTWPDGHTYVGHFHNGKMHGQGKITYPGGRVVEGLWGKGEFLIAQKTQ